MNYNNITRPNHLVFERQQLFYRITLTIIGSVMSLVLFFNLLNSSQENIIAQPISVFSELGSTLYDLISLELNTNQSLDIVSNSKNTAIPETSVINSITPIWRSVMIHQGDSLSEIAARLQLNPEDIAKILALPQAYPILTQLKANHPLNFQLDDDNSILKVSYPINEGQTLLIQRIGDQFEVDINGVSQNSLNSKLSLATATIQSSIMAALHAKLQPGMIDELNQIFGSEFNINTELHPGAQLSILYEPTVNGLHANDILAAQIVDNGHVYQAIRYVSPDGDINYYSPNGQNLETAFLRAPVHYTYISSPFNLHRMHPILHIIRPHYGVDLAAPFGTPVVASSDGRIVFMGRQGGFGNLIEIRFNNTYSTLYGHLSRFAEGIHTGSLVHEGQLIAYVGMSGLASGPHLHYEFHIDGVPHDPMTVHLPTGMPIPNYEHAAFNNYARQLIVDMDNQSNAVATTTNKSNTNTNLVNYGIMNEKRIAPTQIVPNRQLPLSASQMSKLSAIFATSNAAAQDSVIQ